MDEELKQLADEYLEKHYSHLIPLDIETSQRMSEDMNIEKLDEDAIRIGISGNGPCASPSVSFYEDELEVACDCDDYRQTGKCIHIAFLLELITEDFFDVLLPEKEKEEPELIGPHKVIEIAQKNSAIFVNCLAQSHAELLTHLAMIIQNREHLYLELEYLGSAIQAAASSKQTPSGSRLHSLYNLALDLSEMVYQFDDIDYARLVPLQAEMIRVGIYFRERCFRYKDPFHMNLERMLYLACQNTAYVVPEKRYSAINSWISMADEDTIPMLFGDKMDALSKDDKVKLGKRLAELNMKKGAKFFGWKKKTRKR
jgi:hypothetical protein